MSPATLPRPDFNIHRDIPLVAIALANKMARTIRAMLSKGEDYRDPVQAVAA